MTTAAQIAERLDLTESGAGYYGACPHCGYEGAFSVVEREGRVLFHCHAGCTQDEVLKAFRDWEVWGNPASQPIEFPPDHYLVERATSLKADSRENALAMWRRSQPAPGTVAEQYLRSRGYVGPIPPALHYVTGKHTSDGQFHPVMIALAGNLVALSITGVHRTFLRSDGSGKALLEPAKMSLGDLRGAGVPLLNAPIGQELAVSEGIETGLSVLQATGIPTIAALSTGGLKALMLPASVQRIWIAADADEPGMKAAQAAAQRWHGEGRTVSIVRPPAGQDFNDLARSEL
jgi:putative DNA primase/helicase